MVNRKSGKDNRHTPPKGFPEALSHPLVCWLNEWNECKERGWMGDAPPIFGLSPVDEARRLLDQLPHQGTLKLTYKPGKPLSSKLSLETIGDCLNGPREASSKTPLHAQEEEARTSHGRLTDSFKRGRSEDSRDAHHLPDDNGRTSACGQGFHSLVYLLKSLASPVQMCEMVESLSRRKWLNDAQMFAILEAFSDEPRMSEPRCRTFLALIPNIRHNNLRVLAKGLAPRLKHIQGLSPPDTEKKVREVSAKNRAKIGLTTAACARETRPARKTGMVMLQGIKVGEQTQESAEGTGPDGELEGGWEEGPFFDGVVDIEAIAGCASSTFRRFGVEGCFTRLEEANLGATLENSAYFNPFSPTGHYSLDMNEAGERDMFRAILQLDKVNRAHVGINGLLDPSQHGNGHHFRNFRLGGGRPFKFGLVSSSRVRKISKETKAAARKPSKRKKRPRKTAPAASPKRKARGRATPGTGKRYPTIPTVSRVSFDFLHYIRPPPEAKAIPRQTFDQFLGLLMTLDGVSTPGITTQPKSIWRLRVNLLRSMSHVLYFSCQQVVELLKFFPGEDDTPPSGRGSSYREEAFISLFSQIIDESNLDLCLGMFTDSEVSRCEARLGLVSLFMPTKPEGRYKLDLRRFEERQIVALLLELERADPSLQLLGMRHDGKFLEEGSWPFESTPDIPKRGRFRTRVVTRRAFKTKEQLAIGETARWKMAREKLGWHEAPPPSNVSDNSTRECSRIRRTGAYHDHVTVTATNIQPSDRRRAIVRHSLRGKRRKTIQDTDKGARPKRRWSFPSNLLIFKKRQSSFEKEPQIVSFQAIQRRTGRGSRDGGLGGISDGIGEIEPVGLGDKRGDVTSRLRLSRRWSSSADVGMVTDGC